MKRPNRLAPSSTRDEIFNILVEGSMVDSADAGYNVVAMGNTSGRLHTFSVDKYEALNLQSATSYTELCNFF